MSKLRTLILGVPLATACSSAPGNGDAAPPKTAPDAAVTPVVAASTAVSDLEVAFKRAIEAAGPAVVSIYATKTVTTQPFRSPFGDDPLFDFFYDRRRPQPREFQQHGLGSGFLVDADGYILTNNHVVEGADEIKVELADDREFDAQVVGTDPPTDLAVLKIEGDDLRAVEFGDSDQIEVGDFVLAIGNPFGLPRTVSAGIVSAKGRANVGIVDYEDFIQTDAAVNPGNSGGPLVDLQGRVVGINTAIASRSGGNDGIAFAIPIEMAKSVVEQLRGGGKVVRGHLGVLISELSPEMAESFAFEGEDGILVQDVADESPAAKAGLKSGDIIMSLDGEKVGSLPGFRGEIAQRAPGSKVELEVWRDGKAKQLTVTLGESSGAKSPEKKDGPPKIGIALQDLNPQLAQRFSLQEPQGVVVVGVEPGSPAARAGLRPGDLLEQVGDRDVKNAAQALDALRNADLEKGIRLRVRRNGRGQFVLVRKK